MPGLDAITYTFIGLLAWVLPIVVGALVLRRVRPRYERGEITQASLAARVCAAALGSLLVLLFLTSIYSRVDSSARPGQTADQSTASDSAGAALWTVPLTVGYLVLGLVGFLVYRHWRERQGRSTPTRLQLRLAAAYLGGFLVLQLLSGWLT